jgi:hypothetical protein
VRQNTRTSGFCFALSATSFDMKTFCFAAT